MLSTVDNRRKIVLCNSRVDKELAREFRFTDSTTFFYMVDCSNEFVFNNSAKLVCKGGDKSSKTLTLDDKLDLYQDGHNISMTKEEYQVARLFRTLDAYEHYYSYSIIPRYKMIIRNTKNMTFNQYLFICFITGLLDYDPQCYYEAGTDNIIQRYSDYIVINKINAYAILTIYPTYSNILLASKIVDFDDIYTNYCLELSDATLYQLYVNGIVNKEFIINNGSNSCIAVCGITDHQFIVYSDADVEQLMDLGVNMTNIIPNYYGMYNMFHPHFELHTSKRIPIDGVLLHFDDTERYTPDQINGLRTNLIETMDEDYIILMTELTS